MTVSGKDVFTTQNDRLNLNNRYKINKWGETIKVASLIFMSKNTIYFNSY